MNVTILHPSMMDFCEAFRGKIHREGSDKLLQFLLESDFFEAPASTKYHMSKFGGLCEHSVNVYERLKRIIRAEYPDGKVPYSDETIAIVSLLHDVTKVNVYKMETRKQKKQRDDGSYIWEDVTCYTYDDKFVYGHGEKSVFMIMKYMWLSDVEAQAIRWHMGPWVHDEARSYGDACKSNPLVFFLHMADSAATFLDEV